MRGAAGSDKSKHLEYTAYFWNGNINNIAHFSWVITLSPPDLCFTQLEACLNHVSVQINGVFRSKQLSNFQTSFKGVFTQINSSLFQSIQVLLPKYYFQITVFTSYITMDEPSTSTVSIVLLLNYIKYHIHHIRNLNRS